ncbi:MAG: cellulase family glycosylhydrolase, partial [Bacillota bacterium]
MKRCIPWLVWGVMGMGWLLVMSITAASVLGGGMGKVRVEGKGFVVEDGKGFVPFGVNYYRPGTGWAPQLWKMFDAEATRRDLARLKSLGGNCVRVFLSFGSFYQEPGVVSEEGLKKLDQFLALAEEAGVYVHPTGPDMWEGHPSWVGQDRFADERMLAALETFWKVVAARYRGRNVVFAYDLLNEPMVPWNTPTLQMRWQRWAVERYGSVQKAAEAWKRPVDAFAGGTVPIPEAKDQAGDAMLRDYQH